MILFDIDEKKNVVKGCQVGQSNNIIQGYVGWWSSGRSESTKMELLVVESRLDVVFCRTNRVHKKFAGGLAIPLCIFVCCTSLGAQSTTGR